MHFGEPELAAYLAAFARVAAWLQTAPLVSDSTLPKRVRVAVAALVAVVISPLHPLPNLGALFAVLPQELLLGLVAGFTSRLAIYGAETAGQLIGIHLDLNFASTLNADTHEQELPTRRLAYVLACLAFLAAGGLEQSIAALALAADASQTLSVIVDRSGQVVILGLRGAAPMLVAALVANLAVALASRAAPAMNVFAVMLTVILVVGALVLVASAPALIREFVGDARMAAEAPAQVLGVGSSR
jgi:flagellar biosynthetic protein FliR